MSDSDDYQPLASYGPAENLACRETIFDPHVKSEHLRQSARVACQYTRNWPGFQLMLLMNDGELGRGISLWQNHQTLENYINRHQGDVMSLISRHDPDNPWQNHVSLRRSGIVDIYLNDVSMPAANREVVTWLPPGAVRICEIRHQGDVQELRNWWPMIASPSAPRSLTQVNGFQFFAAIDFPDNVYVTYLGFRSTNDLDAYLTSDLHRSHDAPFESADFRASLDISVHTGELLAWFMRDIDIPGFSQAVV